MSAQVDSRTLSDWLTLLETRNRVGIVLGLERVREVAGRLSLTPGCPVITVAGTNGKGSVCAYLESMLQAAGYRTGCYTSPHLLHYRERVRIDASEVTDDMLCTAFAQIEAARGETPLTYFEQGTLAAMWLFSQAGVEALVLEVGLGGRLDAVNVWDADCAVVTSVDIDHEAFLGDTREAIGHEKAGIFRAEHPAVCGDPSPPASVLAWAAQTGARLWRMHTHLHIEHPDPDSREWQLRVVDEVYPALPYPAMAGEYQLRNAACAIAALQSVRERLPVSRQAVRAGLASARQPGRFQIVGMQPLRILDVAHNPHAARALAGNLAQLPAGGKVLAVLAMLADKDVDGVLEALLPWIGGWHIAGLGGERGLSAQALHARLAALAASEVHVHASVSDAWRAACREAGGADTICALGSFLTVAEVMTAISPTMDFRSTPDIHG